MTRIKSMNGYTIYQAGARDVTKHGFDDGSFYVYFSTDVRDFGLTNSTPEYEGCGSLEEAEANCCGNFARAKELVESQTTAASFDEITEIERRLDAGETVEEIEDKLADMTSGDDPVLYHFTGSLRAVAEHSADVIREGIGWTVIFKNGRSWGCWDVWLDPGTDLLEEDNLQEAKQILSIDPNAIIINGYYNGHLGENMTIAQIADGIRWHYDLNGETLARLISNTEDSAHIEDIRTDAIKKAEEQLASGNHHSSWDFVKAVASSKKSQAWEIRETVKTAEEEDAGHVDNTLPESFYQMAPEPTKRRTRLQRELGGELGDNWKRHAENEVAKAAEDLRSGLMTVDADGVVRNCIGRVIMDDMAELLEAAGCAFSRSATTQARDLEVSAELAAYRVNPPKITDEDLAEMRATFGTGTTIVDVLSGRRVNL